MAAPRRQPVQQGVGQQRDVPAPLAQCRQPGKKVIVPPPGDVDAAEARMGEGYECTDWYFCKKSL
ncbi:MAG: hypothetical protein R6W97_04340 [Thiobacillus sp.]